MVLADNMRSEATRHIGLSKYILQPGESVIICIGRVVVDHYIS